MQNQATMIRLLKIFLIISIATALTACPRVRTNTQRHLPPTLIYPDNPQNKWLMMTGYHVQEQKQDILTTAGANSRENADNRSLFVGGWRRFTPDLSLGVSLKVIGSIAFSAQFRFYESKSIDWYGAYSNFGDFGVQTHLVFKDLHKAFAPFAAVHYRQLQRDFDSYDRDTTPGDVNEITLREEVYDYQLGIQLNKKFISAHSSEGIRLQFFIGYSDVEKIKLLEETAPSNYKDQLGFNYGIAATAEY